MSKAFAQYCVETKVFSLVTSALNGLLRTYKSNPGLHSDQIAAQLNSYERFWSQMLDGKTTSEEE